jgi:hypothetical protein
MPDIVLELGISTIMFHQQRHDGPCVFLRESLPGTTASIRHQQEDEFSALCRTPHGIDLAKMGEALVKALG